MDTFTNIFVKGACLVMAVYFYRRKGQSANKVEPKRKTDDPNQVVCSMMTFFRYTSRHGTPWLNLFNYVYSAYSVAAGYPARIVARNTQPPTSRNRLVIIYHTQ